PRCARACIQYWRWFPRVGEPGARRDRPRVGAHADPGVRARAEGRYASYLRRHEPGPRRSRLRAGRPAGRRPQGRIPLDSGTPVSAITAIVTRTCSTSLAAALACAALAATLAGCASNPRGLVPPGTSEPDKFLFEKGTAALNGKKWL